MTTIRICTRTNTKICHRGLSRLFRDSSATLSGVDVCCKRNNFGPCSARDTFFGPSQLFLDQIEYVIYYGRICYTITSSLGGHLSIQFIARQKVRLRSTILLRATIIGRRMIKAYFANCICT